MKLASFSATLSAVGATLFLLACGAEEGSTPSAGVTVTDSSGVRIVRNVGPGAWANGGAWTTEEIFRVGGIDADTDAQFGLVLALDVDEAGNVYVADNQARQVSVFGPDGTLVSRFGQAGDGPGELGPMFMGMFERDGEVWTVDPGAQGIQRFDADGQFLAATPFNIMGGVPMRMDESGDAVVAQRRSMGVDGSVGGNPEAVTTIGTETPDTIFLLPPGETIRIVDGEPRVVMLAPEPVWDVAADGSSVRGMMNTYRLEIRGPDGQLRRVVIRDVEATPVSGQVEDALLDMMTQQFESMGMSMEQLGPMFTQMEFADSLPVMAQAVLEPEGYLWVQRMSDIDELDEGTMPDLRAMSAPRWDVFDGEGTYLGEIELPDRFQPLRIIDGVLWGIAVDEFDVQSVVGRRVVR